MPDAMTEERFQQLRSIHEATEPIIFELCDEVDRLRARCADLERERDSAIAFFLASLEDKPLSNGRHPHLLICNFQERRLGDGFCNCPIGARIWSNTKERDALRADKGTLIKRLEIADECILEAELALEAVGRPEGERLSKGIAVLVADKAALVAVASEFMKQACNYINSHGPGLVDATALKNLRAALAGAAEKDMKN